MSRISVQLLTENILTRAVGVMSPVSAGTLAGAYIKLCAWAWPRICRTFQQVFLSPTGVLINLCSMTGYFYCLVLS